MRGGEGETLARVRGPLGGLRPGAPDCGREALDLPGPGQDERLRRYGHRGQGVRRRQGRRRWGKSAVSDPYSSPRAPQTRYCRVSVPAISTLPQPSLLAVWRKRAVVPANVVSVW